jgi:hypothetical protein
MAPFLLWQQAQPELTYHHEIIRNHHVRKLGYYLDQQSVQGFARASVEKVKDLWRFYQGYTGLRLVLHPTVIDAAVGNEGSVATLRAPHLWGLHGWAGRGNVVASALCGADHGLGFGPCVTGDAPRSRVALARQANGPLYRVDDLHTRGYVIQYGLCAADAKKVVGLGVRTSMYTRTARGRWTTPLGAGPVRNLRCPL